MSTQRQAASSGTKWSDRDFEELLRRASELGRNQKDSRLSVSRLRVAFSAKDKVKSSPIQADITSSQMRRETDQPGEVWGLVSLALWSVVVLGGIAVVGFLLARMLLKVW